MYIHFVAIYTCTGIVVYDGITSLLSYDFAVGLQYIALAWTIRMVLSVETTRDMHHTSWRGIWTKENCLEWWVVYWHGTTRSVSWSSILCPHDSMVTGGGDVTFMDENIDVLGCMRYMIWVHPSSCNYIVGPWPPFIIGLPHDHPGPSVASNLPMKTLVAKQ